jgi:hypothetical protein
MTATDKAVYILWNAPSNQSQQIVKINDQGTITTIFTLPQQKDIDFSSIEVNPSENLLYLGNTTSAKVYQTTLK